MITTILIVFFSLITLITLHELGHFILARRFGVKVEEFGIFLPPRLLGKKIGETIYSINLIPLGAFVKVKGEEGPTDKEDKNNDQDSFYSKPIWKRSLIIAGGVIAFWIVAFVLLTIVAFLGMPQVVEDDYNVVNIPTVVMIVSVAQNSPAEASGLKIGDIIYGLKAEEEILDVSKIKTVQNFIENNKGKETTIKVKRGDNFFDVKIIPRQNVSEGEGPIGVVLARIAYQFYPWYKAPLKGIQETIGITFNIISSLIGVLASLFKGEGLPAGAEFVGPVGIGKIMTEFFELGFASYLRFLAILSIYLAIFNILPIPALDGGKLMFLLIEKLKGKPVSSNLEQKVTAFFFAALLFLLIIITIKDIIKLTN